MKIQGSVALVTGANRGLGAAFTRALLTAGAAKVYAAAREASTVTASGVVPVRLDVTRADQVEALARELGDVSLLVNNAGIGGSGAVLAPSSIDMLRQQFETNAVGPLRMAQAFAPILAASGSSAMINVISALSWATLPGITGSYSASKAAAWALSNAMRQELSAQGTEVLSLHVAFMDTDMARGVPGPKASPDEVARMALAALEAGHSELLADEVTRSVHAGLTAVPPMYLGMLG
ncbi:MULTISPECIES: SDR family oxidoreductase [Burkholderia]|uniref:Short-chain dehydrogenase n=3 Tax=Burkholderia cepacia complex TaxID=87882 RepID=A0ABM6NWZ5_BURCE|nr:MULTISPECIES: SDR family oxidoreductase [Burkholderia]BEV51012.1 SDR family oxidoreductase [Burkholderia contaminans]ABK09962.1 short-chain dehydrogenase/reductase SDR [Burkholderia cenocepacia HI2424]AIO22402.1 short chain dehydrogenase family protein [Burkholderia cepacia ATCC 25416]ALK23677.1 short-chain dehydrogenase [Burkholderia cepacia ATCC 25416]ASE92192.1 short-chain dehydrogenase [Burkholderia cepacia]